MNQVDNFMNQDDYTKLGLIIAIVALLISIIALIYTILAYLLKSGNNIRCSYTKTLSVECDDKYISSITLENLKDKATIIFEIYLRIGRNNYLLIESFENSPLILKPFEVYYKKYEPIIYYDENLQQIHLNKLFDDQKVSKRILLSTTAGKYEVKANINNWNPVSHFFKNHWTSIISPVRKDYNQKSYGSRVKFLLVLKYKDKAEIVIQIYESDIPFYTFEKFSFTNESLKSKDSLEKFIKFQKRQKNINYDKFEVINFKENIDKEKNNFFKHSIEAKSYNFFTYNILGRFLTFYDDIKVNRLNKKEVIEKG